MALIPSILQTSSNKKEPLIVFVARFSEIKPTGSFGGSFLGFEQYTLLGNQTHELEDFSNINQKLGVSQPSGN